MILARICCVCLWICAYFPPAVSQASDDSILTRANDEIARTRDERQHALTVLLEAARQSQNAEPTKAARFLNRAARLQILLNSSQGARANYQAALAILDHSPEPLVRIETLNGLAAVYLQSSNCTETKRLIDQALVLSKQVGSIAGEGEALLTLADCQSLDDSKLALQTVQRSLQLWQSIADKQGMARAYGLLSDLQLVQNDLLEATKSNEAALDIWRELNLPAEQAGALINLGFIEYRKGSWQDCLSYLTQAQGLLDEKSEPFRMGQIDSGIAEAFMESGIPEAGLTKAKEAVEYYRQAQDTRGVVATSWDVGKAYYLLHDYSAAITSLQQTLKDAQANGLVRIAAFCHDFLGRTYSATGDQEKALSEFQTALELYTHLKNPREVARARVLMGQIYVQQHRFDQARQNFQSGLETFDRLTDRVNQSAALHALGKLELRLSHLDLAEAYLKHSIEVTENIRRVSTTGDLMTAASATLYDRYESYIECMMRKHEQRPSGGYAALAFETSELARARALADLLRASQTNIVAGLDPKLAAQEKSLRQTLQIKESARMTLLEKTYPREQLDALNADVVSLEAQYKQVLDGIRARYPAYEGIMRPVAMPLAEIQKEVLTDDDTLLLEYSFGDERSYLWVVSRTDFSSYQLPGRDEINKPAQALYALLSKTPSFDREGPGADLFTEISKLSRSLLDPVAERLRNKRLIIVADGVSQKIPFQTLVLPSTAPANSNEATPAEELRPLMADHEIINEPSASTLALLLRESAHRAPARGSVAILADPVFESDDPRIQRGGRASAETDSASPTLYGSSVMTRSLEQSFDGGHIPRLLGSREEAEAIMKVVPWRTGFQALDFDASRATASTPALAEHSIIHFATHARLNNDHPELSGIVLSLFNPQGQSQDGYLSMSDVYSLRLPVDLVVLSGCRTGLGKEVQGEGLISLTRAFMYAGAGGVAASLWKVDDEATAELMKHFYAGMFQQGLTPAAALRQAQLEMWQSRRWHEPYYWAAFVIQGRYDQKEVVPSRFLRSTVIIASASIIALACLFGLIKRRRRLSSSVTMTAR